MAPRDPLNPSLGDWVYLQAHVGTPYGAAGSTFGHEFTEHIAELVESGYMSLTMPPIPPVFGAPGPPDNQVATVGLVRDIVRTLIGGADLDVNGPGELTPEKFGAKRDGVTDDAPAINAALAESVRRGGGTVTLLPGTYAVASPVGLEGGVVARTHLRGAGEQAACLKALGNIPVVAHAWQHSRISGVRLDADLKGAPCVSAHFDKVVFADNILEGWLGEALRLNDGTYGDLGLLNYITGNHIVQSTGFGIWATYRFIDSWIIDNNVGSTGPNVSVEGGPIRIVANHLNGAPIHNVELRGNKRVTISDNILEGSGLESIIYTMPPWLSDDAPQIQITGNALSNGGKSAPDTKPAVGFYGVAADKVASGLTVTGNIVSCEDPGSGWTYAVQARHADRVAVSGNQWGTGLRTPERLARSAGMAASAFVATGNAGGDGVAVV